MNNADRTARARKYPCARCGAEPGKPCRRLTRSRANMPENAGCHEARLALAEFRGRGPGGHSLVTLNTDNGVFGVMLPGPGTTKADLFRILESLEAVTAAIKHELAERARIEAQELAVLDSVTWPQPTFF